MYKRLKKTKQILQLQAEKAMLCLYQKKLSRSVPKKKCSENMKQI